MTVTSRTDGTIVHHSHTPQEPLLDNIARRMLTQPPAAAPSVTPLTQQQQSAISVGIPCPDVQLVVQQHNDYRARHNTPALTLDNTLSTAAASWAQTLAEGGCILEHSDLASRPGQGENLYSFWANTPGSMECGAAAPPWYNELAMYDYNNVSKVCRVGVRTGSSTFDTLSASPPTPLH